MGYNGILCIDIPFYCYIIHNMTIKRLNMDIKEIIIQLNNDLLTLTKDAMNIRQEVIQLEKYLYKIEARENDIKITLSTLDNITKSELDNELVPKEKVKKRTTHPQTKIPITLQVTPSTLKERIIGCLQENNIPMFPKEIYNFIKTPKDTSNILNAIYGILGNNKHIFIRRDRKWSLKRIGDILQPGVEAILGNTKNLTIKERIVDILSKNDHPLSIKQIYDQIEDKTISKNLIATLYSTLGENKKIFTKDSVTKEWSLLSKENEDLWTL